MQGIGKVNVAAFVRLIDPPRGNRRGPTFRAM
jgi:hypothetical protein